MQQDEAYRIAEERIAAALKEGATELDLSSRRLGWSASVTQQTIVAAGFPPSTQPTAITLKILSKAINRDALMPATALVVISR